MGLKQWLGNLFKKWPADLPRFYPSDDELQLAQFLPKEEYRKILEFDNFYILPFVKSNGNSEQSCFGQGLARLMIRNLMLLRDVSIHGPEDTPVVTCESAGELAQGNQRSGYVSGMAEFGDDGYKLNVDVYCPGHDKKTATVEEVDFGYFIRECSATIARCMGSRTEHSVADAWQVGQPKDADSLVACGEISLRFPRETSAEKFLAIRQALAADPGFVVPAWDLDGDVPLSRGIFLKSLRDDPYNAQLCFETFCAVWKSQGPQPEAMQFCRKAIELSPGHGKAHMCVPHAADRRADMIRHSELGYRLLPGNSFAVNNYTQYLRSNGAPNEKLVELAKEGIAMDPCDPGNYYQAIDLCCRLGAHDEALELGEQLQALFEPVMNERALYCLKQNPERARLIEAGEYDPVAEVRKMLAELRTLARRR